jgi:hypothetical protein
MMVLGGVGLPAGPLEVKPLPPKGRPEAYPTELL